MTMTFGVYGGVLFLLLVLQVKGKAIEQDSERVKRGYSKYGENDFGTAIQVSSGILQYSMPEEHSAIDVSNSYDHGAWQPSSPSSSFDLWLESSPSYQSSSDISSHSISSTSSDHQSSGVLSSDAHLLQLEMPHSGGLHTQISSSSDGGGISSFSVGDIDIGHHQGNAAHISDNVDFNNIADIHSKHYAKSYGK